MEAREKAKRIVERLRSDMAYVTGTGVISECMRLSMTQLVTDLERGGFTLEQIIALEGSLYPGGLDASL